PFPFLELPPELRDCIYGSVLLNYRKNQNSTDRLSNKHECGSLVPGAKESFQQLKAEHGMYTSRCWHEQDHGPHNTGDYLEMFKNKNAPAVYINARGNLCDDLLMLALTCRLVLSRMWRIIYPSKPEPPTRYRATIRNLNFFPLFRFFQTLNRSPIVIHDLQPATIDIRFDIKNHAKDELLHRNTFQHVKRLIELHWLRGFPLWDCITGLSTQTDAPQNPFTEYMYRVRQIVKLFYVD
ncbi:hypothetical protein FB567DRAFT_419860, partial [Paraphoma chrysanthemicola]